MRSNNCIKFLEFCENLLYKKAVNLISIFYVKLDNFKFIIYT